jgi:hypothetical protein
MTFQNSTSHTSVRGRFLVVLVLSLAFGLAGIAWTWRIGLQANVINHQLVHARDALDDLQSQTREPKGNRR